MTKNEFEIDLKNIAITYFMQSPAGDTLRQEMHIFEETQKHILSLSEKMDNNDLVSIKIGTVLTFSMLQKIAIGKMPVKFEKNDWKDIASQISKYAILQDGESYTKLIFSMYESYIRASANHLNGHVSDKLVSSIVYLADELAEKTILLDNGKITEPRYIEDCLWISLEAIFKLLSAMTQNFNTKELVDFSQSITTFAFEYGRLMLLQREQEIVNQFMQSQYKLDAELEEKYLQYLDILNAEAKQFQLLIDNAFMPDFRNAFLHSIILAQKTGVDKNEILTSIDDIDAFFLD